MAKILKIEVKWRTRLQVYQNIFQILIFKRKSKQPCYTKNNPFERLNFKPDRFRLQNMETLSFFVLTDQTKRPERTNVNT